MKVLSAPARIVWEVTNRCNLQCTYCYRDAGNKSIHELSEEEAINLSKRLGAMQVFHVTISGGEPLLRQDIFRITSTLSGFGIGVYLDTNGTLISNEVAQRIKTSGIKGVAVSLDGITAQTHESLRPPKSSFNRTIKGIESLLNMNIDVGLQATITKRNYHEMSDMVDFCLEEGIKGVKFSRVSPIGRASINFRDLELPYEFVQPLISSLYQRKIELADKLRIDFGENLVSEFINLDVREPIDQYISECEAGRFKCAISPDGYVRPCEFFTDSRYYAGNIRLLPLDKIWQESPIFDYFRTDNLYGECVICREHCPARCPAAAVYAGDHTSHDPTCPYLLMKRGH